MWLVRFYEWRVFIRMDHPNVVILLNYRFKIQDSKWFIWLMNDTSSQRHIVALIPTS